MIIDGMKNDFNQFFCRNAKRLEKVKHSISAGATYWNELRYSQKNMADTAESIRHGRKELNERGYSFVNCFKIILPRVSMIFKK